MQRNISNAQVFNAGSNPPVERRVVSPDGRVRTEKITNMPYAKMVDLAGNVRRVPLSQASGQRSPNNPAAHRTLHKLKSKGFIRYDRCAFFDAESRVWMPADMLAKGPQHYGCDGTKGSVRQACNCVEEIIKLRREHNAQYWVEYEEQRKTFAQKQFEDEQARNKAMLEHLAKFAEVQTKLTAPQQPAVQAQPTPEPAKQEVPPEPAVIDVGGEEDVE